LSLLGPSPPRGLPPSRRLGSGSGGEVCDDSAYASRANGSTPRRRRSAHPADLLSPLVSIEPAADLPIPSKSVGRCGAEPQALEMLAICAFPAARGEAGSR